MARRATLKDVAAAAGVSVTTVSLVLNDRPARVSAEKREAIAQAVKQLNYVPNQNARSLVTKQSKLVALIVPDIENLFFAALAKCVEDECAAQGYSLIVANSDDSRESEQALLRRLTSRGVDGVLLIPARESCAAGAGAALREDVERVTCPVVLIDRLTQCGWCDAVGFDNYLGGRLAAQYLLEGGHKRIGIVTGDVAESSAADRRRGFVDAIEQAGEQFDSALCVSGDYRFDGGYHAADQIIDGGATAVFCCNDVMALGFRQRMAERGLHVTEDMQVIGYDNILRRFGSGFAHDHRRTERGRFGRRRLGHAGQSNRRRGAWRWRFRCGPSVARLAAGEGVDAETGAGRLRITRITRAMRVLRIARVTWGAYRRKGRFSAATRTSKG